MADVRRAVTVGNSTGDVDAMRHLRNCNETYVGFQQGDPCTQYQEEMRDFVPVELFWSSRRAPC
jgi:hypothetical protein